MPGNVPSQPGRPPSAFPKVTPLTPAPELSDLLPQFLGLMMHSQCRVSSLWKGMQGIALRFDGEGRCDFDRRVNTWGPWSTF